VFSSVVVNLVRNWSNQLGANGTCMSKIRGTLAIRSLNWSNQFSHGLLHSGA
jgi:hypothetical protein